MTPEDILGMSSVLYRKPKKRILVSRTFDHGHVIEKHGFMLDLFFSFSCLFACPTVVIMVLPERTCMTPPSRIKNTCTVQLLCTQVHLHR